AFLQGHLYLEPRGTSLDLAFYHNKYYIYWPPVPVLVYMPLVALFGVDLPGALICASFGACNVWLIINIAESLNTRLSLNLPNPVKYFTAIFWGLGTVHFYMSISGEVWFISQIMAQTFLLASILLILNRAHICIAGVFFSLAVYTRNNLLFSALFIIPLFLSLNNKRDKLKSILLFSIPFILFSIANLWYNYARFGNMLDNGIKYHLMSSYFYETYKTYGYFSMHYLLHNLHVEFFLAPHLRLGWPFIVYDPVGFGFLWASPVFLLALPAAYIWVRRFFVTEQTSISRQVHFLMTMSAFVFAVIALVILLIMGTGWAQFAARYTLDFYIFIIIFILLSWNTVSKIKYINAMAVFLLFISMIVQYNGVLLYRLD
ncbi:MAG: hypothetical protein ACHQNT_11895, partial [Bacteroidia bacterium]